MSKVVYTKEPIEDFIARLDEKQLTQMARDCVSVNDTETGNKVIAEMVRRKQPWLIKATGLAIVVLLLTGCVSTPPGTEPVNIHSMHRYAFLISAYGSRMNPPLDFPLDGVVTNGSKIFMDLEHLAYFEQMNAWFNEDIAMSKSD